MKKTRFLFALFMAIVMMAMSPGRAWAEEYPVITGGTHTIDIAAYRDGYTEFSHYTTIFKYVAPNGGTLTVYTEGNGDTASAFFDEDKKTLTYDDESGNSANFKFSYKVVKDHTYYIGVCSSKDFTNYTLVIDESDLCDHEIVNHVCTICGKHQSRIVSVPAGVTVTDDDGNPITSEDYIWEGRTVNISVNASEVTAPIYIGLDATTAEGSRLNIRRNNSFVMPGSDVTLNYMAIPSEPLCFEAKEDGAKIGFSSIVSDYILYYSTDKENWTSFNYDDTHYLPTLANAGDKIYLIGNVTSSSEWSYTQVKIEDANVAASGKLSSILGGATIIYDFGCYKMFYYNGNLISAPDMSDITEIGKCGCDEMFRGCSALTTAPAMSSLTAIGNLGCDGMFYVCSALTTAPAMSSLTTIGDEGCYQMFGDCSALTTAPAMSSLTAIGNLGCDGMFSHCPQLTGFEFNTVPYVVESGFYDFGTDNITLNLSDDSYVYKEGENPGFPTVTSVTAPCTLNLTGSVVENHANLTLNHGTAIDDEEVAATCTEPGHTAGKHCSVCDAALEGLEEISALGHTSVTDEAVDATCTESGRTEGKHCSVCDGVLVAQEEIPALGHAFSEEMSLCEDGYHHYACTREECGAQSEDKYAKMFGEYRKVTGNANPTETIELTKVGTYYYASLYTDFPYVVGGDVAYYVKSVGDGVVTLGNTANVRAGSGVIFRSTNSKRTIVYDPEGFENTAPADNLLTGSTTAITAPNANQYAFGLSDTGYLGFWHWTGMTIPAWSAYLDLGSEPSGARGFRIVFDDEPNGIREIPDHSLTSGNSYDLMGRRVSNKFRGLTIVDGKKVYVK